MGWQGAGVGGVGHHSTFIDGQHCQHGHSDIKRGWGMEILAFTASVAEKVIAEEGWKWALYEPNCSFYHKHQLKRSLSNLSPRVRSD